MKAVELALWRSEPMRLVQLIVPAEAAHGTARRLGALGCVELKDLNSDKSAFQRTYANQVRARESPPAPPRAPRAPGPSVRVLRSCAHPSGYPLPRRSLPLLPPPHSPPPTRVRG